MYALGDDAHGFMTFNERGCVSQWLSEINIYISTFVKALAMTGGFVAAHEDFINYFKYNLRSQTLPLLNVASVPFKLDLFSREGEQRRAKL